MTTNALLSTIVLVSFLVTIVLAIGSYLAYKVRERRRPPSRSPLAADGFEYFERVFDDGAASSPWPPRGGG